MKKSLILVGLLAALSGCEKQTPEQHLINAEKAIGENKYEVAVIELKNAARLSPEDATIRYTLGKTYEELGRFSEAEKELERALKLGHPVNEVIPLLSTIYKRSGDTANLLKLSDKAKGLKGEKLAQLRFYQLQVHVGQGNTTKAEEALLRIKLVPEGGVYKLLAPAYEHVLNRDLDQALEHLAQVLASYPNHADTLKLKAQLHLNNQQTDEATATYQAYLEAHPDDVDAKFLLARLYSDLRQTDKAEPLVDELLAEYPQQPILLQLKASALANQQNYQQAFEFAERSLATNPDDVSSRLIAGISAYFLEDLETTNQHLSFIANMLPADHIAFRFLADTQVRLGLTLDANETVQRFEELTERDADLMSNIGLALLREGERKKAQAILDKQSDDIDQLNVKARLAQLKLSLNDVSGILDLEQILSSSEQLPSGDAAQNQLNSTQLENTLAQAYFSNKQYDKALEIAKRWQQSSDKELNVRGLAIEARVRLQQKDKVLAKAAFEKALSLDPDNAGLELALIPLQHDSLATQLPAIEALLDKHPENLPVILKHYVTTTLLKQPQQMTAHLQKLIQAQPDNSAFKSALAKIWLLEKQPEKAIPLFEQVKQANDDKPANYWEQLARAYIESKQTNKAVELYKQWFETQPNHPNAVVGMLKALHIQGKTQEALDIADKYLNEVRDNHIEVQMLRLYSLAGLRQFNKLDVELRKLPKQLLAQPFVQGLSGQVLLSKGQAEQAVAGLKSAYESASSPMNAQWVFRALAQSNQKPQAVEFLTKHLEQNPNDELNTISLANLALQSDTEKAQELYKAAIKLNNKNFIAHNNIAHLLSQQGDYQQAYRHALQALEIRPNEGAVLDTVGSIELKLDKTKQALSHMQSAVDKLGDKVSDEVMLNYIEALYRNDKHALAKRRSEQYAFTTDEGKAQLQELMSKFGQ